MSHDEPAKSSDPVVSEAPDEDVELEEALCEQVRDWVRRVSPRLEYSKWGVASLKITLLDPGWDDQNRLVLEAQIEEFGDAREVNGVVTRKVESKS